MANISSIDGAPKGPPFFRSLFFVFLPFAAGYFLSYLFRTINALLAGRLSQELGLDAAQLGLLTSAYFFAAAAAQIPLGIAIDRRGPRVVQGTSMCVAAVGAALFSVGTDIATLTIARALIGLGVAGALVSGLKAIVVWFDKDRVPVMNGILVSIGALGALTATVPLESVLSVMTWRDLFAWLAVASAAVGLVILLVVPEEVRRGSGVASSLNAPMGFSTILLDARFWRLAPLSATVVGVCLGAARAMGGTLVARRRRLGSERHRRRLDGDGNRLRCGRAVAGLRHQRSAARRHPAAGHLCDPGRAAGIG